MKTWFVALLALAACGGDSSEDLHETDCGDGLDDDGDQLTDCSDADCAADPVCLVPAVEACTGGTDEDGDTFVDCDDDDCWEDAACYKVDDDVDLTTTDGDPALDIDKAGITLVAGTATFFITTEGAWPPSSTFYWWYAYFEIDNDGNTPVAGVSVVRQNGVDATMVTGIPAANAIVRQTPRGVWVRMTGVPAIGIKYYIESGVQKTSTGTRVTDTVVGAPAPLP